MGKSPATIQTSCSYYAFSRNKPSRSKAALFSCCWHDYSSLEGPRLARKSRYENEIAMFTLTGGVFCRQMIGMEQCVSREIVEMVEDLLVKLREDKLVPNLYTYNGVLFV